MSKATIKAALERVNDVRAALGVELLDKMPKGILSSSGDCPIHNALGFRDNNVGGEATGVYSRDVARVIARVWGTKMHDAKREQNKLGSFCYEYDWHETSGRWVVENPPEIKAFINKFDSGEFKTLIAPYIED